MIEVKDLSKDYLLKKKAPGLKGAITGLVKNNYETLHAVQDLNFTIGEGEIVGFIGPNGAGKSTTIKMMSGILTPTKGSVYIGGGDITKHRKEVVRSIGVVFGQRTQLNWDLRLGESFELLKHIYQIKQSDYDETLDVMDSILGIKEIINQPVRQMSLGQRVKSFVAEALVDGKWTQIDPGESFGNIGYKRILRFATIQASALRINILDSRGPLCISSIEAYCAPE